MASSGGVRTCIGTTPVPSPSLGAARDTAPSTLNASIPVTSATHNDAYPRRSARLARSRTAAGPERMNGAAVTASEPPPASATGTLADCAVSITATIRLPSGDVWQKSDHITGRRARHTDPASPPNPKPLPEKGLHLASAHPVPAGIEPVGMAGPPGGVKHACLRCPDRGPGQSPASHDRPTQQCRSRLSYRPRAGGSAYSASHAAWTRSTRRFWRAGHRGFAQLRSQMVPGGNPFHG